MTNAVDRAYNDVAFINRQRRFKQWIEENPELAYEIHCRPYEERE